MRSLRGQKGLSSIAWLMILACIGFFATCLFKIGPLYIDDWSVKAALATLKNLSVRSESEGRPSRGEIQSYLSNHFTVNNIRGDEIKSLDIDLERDKFIVNMNYEKRVNLFYNIDVVVVFENQFDSSKPDECCTPSSE